MSGIFSRLNSLDLYRKIHSDFTKGTIIGALLSLVGVILMTSLFVLELNSWLTIDTTTRIVLDSNGDDTMQINFNVTLPNLPCYLSSVDVSDVLGIRKVNITKDIRKWRLSTHGGDANKVASKEAHTESGGDEGETVDYPSDDELADIRTEMIGKEGDDKVGVFRVSNHQDFDSLIASGRIVMVNFYAPWCIWSRRLAPVWDYSANLMKVDCTFYSNQDLCAQHHVHAFPTIKVFRNHDAHANEHYRDDRTPHTLIDFVEAALDKELPKWRRFTDDMILHAHSQQKSGNDLPRSEFHEGSVVQTTEGCMIAGHVTVKKVPGNFHITGHSVQGFSFVPEKINVTHSISHLSFGSQQARQWKSSLGLQFCVHRGMLPSYKQRLLLQMAQQQNDEVDQLSGLTFVSNKPNTTHEHYLKVVSNELRTKGETVQTYQYESEQYPLYTATICTEPYHPFKRGESLRWRVLYSVNSHFYEHPEHISEARFTYDLSPMSIVIEEKTVPLYHFLTSVCAIIGGVFTVIGFGDSILYHASNQAAKLSLGKHS